MGDGRDAAYDGRGRHSNTPSVSVRTSSMVRRQQIFHGAGEVPGERELC